MATSEYTVTGGGGLRLHAREWGNPRGRPIVFIHGFSGCLLCWSKQFTSELADEFRLVAFDNRGHGMSEKPLEPEHYTDGRLWADDVAAVIQQLRLERPVLVGWYYGGFIICDYLREHGQDDIAGVHLVGGAVTLNQDAFGTLIGPGFFEPFPDITSHELAANISGLRRFVRGLTAGPLPVDELEAALIWNAVVPPQVRANLGARLIDSDDVLAALRVPILLAHGRADTIVMPAMAEHVLASCPAAEASWYDAIGHSPQSEAPARFNEELASFVRKLDGTQRAGTLSNVS